MPYRRLASFAVRHAKAVAACWLVIAAIAAGFALRLPDVLGDHGLTVPHGESARVRQLLADDFPAADEPVALLFDNAGGEPRRDFRAGIGVVLDRAARIDGVSVAASPLSRPGMENGRYAYALLRVPGDAVGKRAAIRRIRHEIAAATGFRIAMTGKPVVQEDVNRSSRRDLQVAETVGVPSAFFLLLLTFGGLLAALVPIVAGTLSVAIAMGILYGIGALGLANLSVFVHNVVPMVGMAVCVDFALIMVGRFREEAAFFGVRKSVERTAASAGRAIAVSAACVALALVGTFAIRMPMFNSVALGAIIVLLVSLLANLTFVPALLALVGHRLSADGGVFRRAAGGWQTMASAVMKRPRLIAFAACAILAVCLLPAAGMRLAVPGPESLPAGTPSREAAAILASRFAPPDSTQAYVLTDFRQAEAVRTELARDRAVLRADRESISGRQGLALFSVRVRGDESSADARRWARDAADRYGKLGALVGGEAKYRQEAHDEIFGRLGYALAFAVVSNFLVLARAFRSLLLPAKAVAMNLLSICASYGIVAWLFQNGRFGLEPSDVAIMIPAFIFGLAFGVSMDYGVFLMTRIEERYRQTGDNELAVREGLASSGRLIASAAAIMIAATAPFALAGVAGVKQLGVGLAAAVFIDATIVRLALVPSLMKLFGEWNWRLPFARN